MASHTRGCITVPQILFASSARSVPSRRVSQSTRKLGKENAEREFDILTCLWGVVKNVIVFPIPSRKYGLRVFLSDTGTGHITWERMSVARSGREGVEEVIVCVST